MLAKEHLTANQRVLINCESRGGSPHPTLALSLDGTHLDSSSNGPISQAITAAAELNTKVLACSAINRAMQEHTITETILRVHCKSLMLGLKMKAYFLIKEHAFASVHFFHAKLRSPLF